MPIIAADPAVPIPEHTLYQRIITPPTTWDQPLWDQIRRHEPIATLRGVLQEGKRIIIVSDATVDHQDHGACAWAIWSQQLLWSSEGRVPAEETDMYSGLAEVYGVYHSIQFLNRYVTQYPIIYHHNARVTVYCDNQGVIDRITGATDEYQPRDMIQDDYPVFQEIAILRQQLQPICFTFTHVNGHLDTKK